MSMPQKWVSEKQIETIIAHKSQRYREFWVILLVFAIALSGSLALEGHIQQKNADIQLNSINARIEELRAAYQNATSFDRLQIDVQLSSISEQGKYYAKLKAWGITAGVIFSFVAWFFIVSRAGHQFTFRLKESLTPEEISAIKANLKKRFSPGWFFRCPGTYFFIVKKWELDRLCLRFDSHDVFVALPDDEILFYKIRDIREILQSVISGKVVSVKHEMKHLRLHQGFFPIFLEICRTFTAGIILILIFLAIVLVNYLIHKIPELFRQFF